MFLSGIFVPKFHDGHCLTGLPPLAGLLTDGLVSRKSLAAGESEKNTENVRG